jgi:hypothetical protein
MTMADLDRLIEEGLSRYGQGDLDGALTVWEQVLSLDPDNAQANSYVDYVRQNYELLTSDTGATAGGDSASGPFGISADEPDYQIEILPGDVIPTSAPPTFVDPMDEGWFIDGSVPPKAAETVAAPEVLPATPNGRQGTAPIEIAAEFHGTQTTPGFGEQKSAGFSSQPTDVKKRDLGFVQASSPAIRPPPPPEPSLDSQRHRRASVPPELKMTIRTPAPEDGRIEATQVTKPPAPQMVIRVPEKPAPKPPPLVIIEGETLAANIMANVEATIAAAQGSAPDHKPPDLAPVIPYAISPAPMPAAVVPDLVPDLVSSPFDPIVPPKPDPASEATTPSVPIFELGAAGPLPDLVHGPASIANPIELGAAGGPGEPGVPLAPGVLAGSRPTTRDIASKPITRDVSPKSPTRELPADLKFPVDVSRPADNPMVSAPTRDLGLREESSLTKHDIRPFRPPATVPPPTADDGTRHDLVLPFDPMDARGAQILDDVDDGVGPGEIKEDRTRRRITALLDRAAEWNRLGDPEKAVTAVDLALSEDPNSALAQKLIHRNRDTIMAVFQAYLGDLQRQPILARPLHELATAPISPRGAFLLSRVDGSLSLDEILDVSGMPRLEAYRYLCQLFLRGILR